MEKFIGKTINRDELTAYEAEINAPGEYSPDYTVAEVFLRDFECNGTDSKGRNAYSFQLFLDEQDRIVRIQRLGHCHMCGGQGSDDDLNIFPHQTLEEELEQVMVGLAIS